MKALVLLIFAILLGIPLVIYDSFLLFLIGVIIMAFGYYLPIHSDMGLDPNLTWKRLDKYNQTSLRSIGNSTESFKMNDEPEHKYSDRYYNFARVISIDLRMAIVLVGLAYVGIAFIYWMIFL